MWWRCCDTDFNSVLARLPCCLTKGPLKQDFLDIYLTTFSKSVNSEKQNLWGSSFVSKYSKFNIDFKIEAKNGEKVFCFRDNCIWIGIVKLSLLRTGYFSLEAKVLRSSSKILHVNKRDFFRFNWLNWAGSNECDKGAVTQISTVFWHVYHVVWRRVLWNRIF